ncbi:class I SAM-dependent methyltransferase [Novipirellula sp.]|uniref:class I SAM-dependent methyltransferase n=1 Tax=Novipirellula sp. TaxID=2795430 RepID=UPI003566F462
MDAKQHETLTIEQFTQQAIPFAKLPGHSTALDILADLACPDENTIMLDVACGPGIVACHFAPSVRHVTGLDLTPEMIRQATQLQAERGITNANWIEGTALPLPFDDNEFSLVLTRYSFHHFRQPAAVMKELIRVCMPGGRVVVADVSLPEPQTINYDKLEMLRDPSHVHALSRDEFSALFIDSALSSVQFAEYKVDLALEDQIQASFPVEGGAERIRRMIREDVGVNLYDVNAYFDSGSLHYSIPIVVGAATKNG